MTPGSPAITRPQKQLLLPFSPIKERRLERIERLLSGELRKHIRPASELTFDFASATEVARNNQPVILRSEN